MKKVKTVCVPIDVDSCSSTISGYVRYPDIEASHYATDRVHLHADAQVSLSDCNRVITWDLCSHGYALEKIDRAIAALSKLRKHMALAQVLYVELEAEVEKRNKGKKPETLVESITDLDEPVIPQPQGRA